MVFRWTLSGLLRMICLRPKGRSAGGMSCSDLPPAAQSVITKVCRLGLGIRVLVRCKRAGRDALKFLKHPARLLRCLVNDRGPCAMRSLATTSPFHGQPFLVVDPVELLVVHAHALVLLQDADPARAECAPQQGRKLLRYAEPPREHESGEIVQGRIERIVVSPEAGDSKRPVRRVELYGPLAGTLALSLGNRSGSRKKKTASNETVT